MSQKKFIIDGGFQTNADSVVEGTVTISTPVDANHATTKSYVDGLTSDLDSNLRGYTDAEIASLQGTLGASISGVSSDVSNLTTDDVAEGSNLYFTDARAAGANASAIADAESNAIATAAADATSKVNAATSAFQSADAGLQSQINSNDSDISDLQSDKVSINSKQALHASDALSIGGNIITLRKGDGSTETVDISPYLDDTNLSRIVSGTMNSSGVATFSRDDSSTFTVDMSVLLDDTNLSRITAATWNTGNGVLTLTRNDNTTVAVDLDGRYQAAGSYVVTGSSQALTSNSVDSGKLKSVVSLRIKNSAGTTLKTVYGAGV